MKEGTWVQPLSAESTPLIMQVRDGQVRFSQQSAAQEQIVMLVELGHLSIAQAQLVLERQLPIFGTAYFSSLHTSTRSSF